MILCVSALSLNSYALEAKLINSDLSSQPISKRLQEMNIQLPTPTRPMASYVPFKIINDVLYISGQISIKEDGTKIAGKLGKSLTIEEGQAAARQCGLNILTWLNQACNGNLECISSINQITVLVNASEDFTEHPKVANGVSDLLIQVFGKEIGEHTRIAFGAASLPLGVAVEVSGIFNLKNY